MKKEGNCLSKPQTSRWDKPSVGMTNGSCSTCPAKNGYTECNEQVFNGNKVRPIYCPKKISGQNQESQENTLNMLREHLRKMGKLP